jgi:hypothetical protein
MGTPLFPLLLGLAVGGIFWSALFGFVLGLWHALFLFLFGWRGGGPRAGGGVGNDVVICDWDVGLLNSSMPRLTGVFGSKW